METKVIADVIENMRGLLVLLAETEVKYRQSAEIQIENLLIQHGIVEERDAILRETDEKIAELRAQSESMREQLASLEGFVSKRQPEVAHAFGIDLSKLDPATAYLVQSGHLPTITQLGGQIENAAQSEDYGVALA